MSKTYYESKEDILNRMLSKVDGLSTLEGSTTYIQQSPIAIELEDIKLKMNEIIKINNIIDAYENGYEDEVVRYCAEDGVDRKSAKSATGIETFYGTVGTTIPVGTKFSNKMTGLVYETTLKGVIGSNGEVDILSVAKETGYKYNSKAGTLSYMPTKLVGVTSCTNKTDFSGGYDIESIEDLYYRHDLKVRQVANGVNKAQYEIWCLEVDGVGSAKIYPLTDETMTKKRGHVCCVITDAERKSASAELCSKVKNYIDPNNGDGTGEASMNAIVHVISAQELKLNISLSLQLENGYSVENVKSGIEEVITSYLKEKAFSTKSISITRIGALIYSVEGVIEYDSLTINGTTSNITVADNQIAVLGEVTIND